MIVDSVLVAPLKALLRELEACELLNDPQTRNGDSDTSTIGFESTIGNERQQCPELIQTAANKLRKATVDIRDARRHTTPHGALTQSEREARKEDRDRIKRHLEAAKEYEDGVPASSDEHVAKRGPYVGVVTDKMRVIVNDGRKSASDN